MSLTKPGELQVEIQGQEPMSEKKNLINHVRIVEQSPARVIVHWRYPLKIQGISSLIIILIPGGVSWSDWYFTIYPDGTAFKRLRLWTDGRRTHEFHESMVITGPGQHPETVVDPVGVLTLADAAGETEVYHWTEGPPDDPDYENMKIHIINFMSDWDPYTIGDFIDGDVYSSTVTPFSIFPSWNHWPIGQSSLPREGIPMQLTGRHTVHLPMWKSPIMIPDLISRKNYCWKV